jgi:branched-chain amino acid transport system ATP-binding protein
MTGLLAIQDASVSFGGVRALDGVSMEIQAGSCCGIIGPNGSGKTTLLGVISRLTGMTAGHLIFDGIDYSSSSPAQSARLGIARTFQTVRLLPSLSVIKNVMIGAASSAGARHPLVNLARPRRLWAESHRARDAAEQALERVAMSKYQDALPYDLPYGLQRKVEIARALATSPKLLLLDEPMAGMRQAERDGIAAVLQELSANGLTQILVEHDLAMIYRVCDTSYALDFGRVIAEGPPRLVASQPMVREAYLGRDSRNDERELA